MFVTVERTQSQRKHLQHITASQGSIARSNRYFRDHYIPGFKSSVYALNADRFRPAIQPEGAAYVSWFPYNKHKTPYHFSIYPGHNGYKWTAKGPTENTGGFHLTEETPVRTSPQRHWYFDEQGAWKQSSIKYRHVGKRSYTVRTEEPPPQNIRMVALRFSGWLKRQRRDRRSSGNF